MWYFLQEKKEEKGGKKGKRASKSWDSLFCNSNEAGLFFVSMFLWGREQAHDCIESGRAEREVERESLKQAPGPQSLIRGLVSRPWDHDPNQKWLSHPGAPSEAGLSYGKWILFLEAKSNLVMSLFDDC